MYGHIAKIAEAEKKGIEAAGGKADLYQWVSSTYAPTSRLPQNFSRALILSTIG